MKERVEITFHMRDDEVEATRAFLSQIRTESIDQEKVDLASRLFREWNPSHGIDEGDAILAATAILTGGVVFTLNKKHFPMPDLLSRKAW